MRKPGLVFLGLFLLFPMRSASAGDADICYSRPTPNEMQHITANTPLRCPRAGRQNLAQLARAGWNIVSMTQIVAQQGGGPGQVMMTQWMVVIEKLGNASSRGHG